MGLKEFFTNGGLMGLLRRLDRKNDRIFKLEMELVRVRRLLELTKQRNMDDALSHTKAATEHNRRARYIDEVLSELDAELKIVVGDGYDPQTK